MSIKDTQTLFNEINLSNQISKDKLNSIYQNLKIIQENYKRIKDFSLNDIKSKVRHINDPNFLIALMMKANELLFGYSPREIQIISILFFVYY